MTLVAQLARRIDDVVGPLVDGFDQVALLDFPNHINIGDAAIFAGELAFLRSHGLRIAYTCDQRSYVADHLRRAMPSGVILLHGGGNLGDIYPRHQRLRERVIADFPDYPIVQLPQTMTFEDRANLERAAAVFNRHERLTVLLRDADGVERFARDFTANVKLCPDMAFCLGDLRPAAPPGRGVLWLARTDGEEADQDVERGDGVRRLDWAGPSPAWRRRRYASRALSFGTSAAPWPGRLAWRPAKVMFPRLAGERVRSGAALLTSAGVVVTDRLHGHILSLLCRVPHVLNDNRTGKVRAFYETWTRPSPLAHWADTPGAALALAADLDRQSEGAHPAVGISLPDVQPVGALGSRTAHPQVPPPSLPTPGGPINAPDGAGSGAR